MPFELAEAYVQLSERGLKTVTGQVDKIKTKLQDATGTSNSLSDSMDGAGKSIGESAGAAESLSDAMQAIKDVPLADMAGSAEGLAEGLGGSSEGAKKLGDMLGGSDGKLAGMVAKNAKFLGILGAVGVAAWKVGNAILDWSLEALNLELERALDMSKDLARVHQQVTKSAVDDAGRLASIDEKRVALQEALNIALRNNATTQRELRSAQEAAQEGWGNWFAGFADGKWDAEVKARFERAQVQAAATKASVEELADALGSLGGGTQDQRSSIAERLREEQIFLDQGAEALRRYQLVKEGLSQGEAAGIAKQESNLAEAQEEKQATLAIAQAYEAQVDALRVKFIEVEKGVEAAQREMDRQSGMNEQQRANLALMREKIRLTEEAKAKETQLAEAAKQAEEEASQAAQKRLDAQRQVRQSFEKQVESLRLKNILLTEGQAAADRERERLQGFSEEQSKILAHMREKNALAEKQAKLEAANQKYVQGRVSGERKINEEKRKQAQVGNLASLADQNQLAVLNEKTRSQFGGMGAMGGMQAGAGGAADAKLEKVAQAAQQQTVEIRKMVQTMVDGRMRVTTVPVNGPNVDPKQIAFGKRS